MKSLLFQSHGLLFETINHHILSKVGQGNITQKIFLTTGFFHSFQGLFYFRPHSKDYE